MEAAGGGLCVCARACVCVFVRARRWWWWKIKQRERACVCPLGGPGSWVLGRVLAGVCRVHPLVCPIEAQVHTLAFVALSY